MGANKQDFEKIYFYAIVASYLFLAMNIYYFAHPLFASFGASHPVAIRIFKTLANGGLFNSPAKTKLWAFLFMVFSHIVKSGKGKEISWWIVGAASAIGLTAYFLYPLPHHDYNHALYITTSIIGYACCAWSAATISRNLDNFKKAVNDVYETFDQCTEKIETPDSINIPLKFQYKQKLHDGWINVVNPFRATMILGTPGSGKSFSVYNPFISQAISKGYCMFCYDYKYPDLTEIVFNETIRQYPLKKNPEHKKNPNAPEWIKDPQAPKFYVINFNDPRYSNRCNPMDHRYINDPADSAEIADIIMKNVAPETVEKEDFFSRSAKVYIDCCIYFLSIYKGGRYCSFPHLIELMGIDYKKVFTVMSGYDELETKIKPFAEALKAGAQDQLQGQIASATIPLNKMASPALYWVLSGDDFSLDINNPDDPKILCIGNDPDRQAIYGTTLALYTSRMFKLINHKHKRKCMVLLDELPTIFIKGLDNLIATARSNKVAIALGAQDKSQLIRDYSQKEADVIFNTVGNIFAGQVNGKTAEDLSKSFGKEFREQQSQTRNIDSESIQVSFHQEELLPQSRIETLTQGYFFGKVADDNKTPIEKKFFCGEIQIDVKGWNERMKSNRKMPIITKFDDDAIREDVYGKEMSTNVLRKHCIEKIIEDGVIESPDIMETKVDAMVKTLSDKQKKEILDTVVEEMINENKNKEVMDNFKRIRREVEEIIEENLPDDYYSNGKENGNGTDPLAEITGQTS